jgi:hypothetical protein
MFAHNDLFFVYADPKEKKRQRQRLYYAQNRDEILKRQRQSREQKKTSNALLNGAEPTPATGQSAVTQLHKLTGASCVTPDFKILHIVSLQPANYYADYAM